MRLKKRFENIHVITTEDAGVSAARNAGLRAAKGTFVTFVDADDRLRPKAIEILLDCMMWRAAVSIPGKALRSGRAF